MKTKNILRILLAAIFVLGTVAVNAQSKIYVHKTNGTADEYDIADVDSISFTPPSLEIIYPETGKYGLNILADDFVDANKTEYERYEYSVRALVGYNSSLKIVIKSKHVFYICQNFRCRAQFPELHETCPACGGKNTIEAVPLEWGGYNQDSDDNWKVTNVGSELTFKVIDSRKPADASVIFTNDCIVEYYENGAEKPTKVKHISVKNRGTFTNDDEYEREMLIAFYQSTNGGNWKIKDNWCSDKPLSQWYGVETGNNPKTGKNSVITLNLPNNNLTGDAKLTGLTGLNILNILKGNKLESLTIDDCATFVFAEHYGFFQRNSLLYFDSKSSLCSLKALNISRSSGDIYVGGNFSAETVTITDCFFSGYQGLYFNSPSTKIGTLTVSNSDVSGFYANNSVIGNIIIDNCTFFPGSGITVGDKTSVNNCKNVQNIYSRKCSDLTVTNTECDDIRCGENFPVNISEHAIEKPFFVYVNDQNPDSFSQCGYLLFEDRGGPGLNHDGFVWAESLPEEYREYLLPVIVTYHIIKGGGSDCQYPIIGILEIQKR